MPETPVLPQPKLDALLFGAHRLSEREQVFSTSPDEVFALTDNDLFEACGVRIAFTGRHGGLSEGPYASLNVGVNVDDDPSAIAANRNLLLSALGAESAPLISMNQVHGSEVVTIAKLGDLPEAGKTAQNGCDAAVVNQPSIAALVCVADCLPLVIVSPLGGFAVVHAGWRGTVAHIARKACLQLAKTTGCEASSFNAYIGAHIRSECFEVGEEVARRFADEFGACVLSDERHVSLSDAVLLDLESAGMREERVCDAGICTVCESDRYFSYRATNGLCGRQCACAVRLP